MQAARYRWLQTARPNQIPPRGDWFAALYLAGRGFGKTRIGAEEMADHARRHPGARYALVSETLDDVRDTMVEGESGLLSILPVTALRGGSVEKGWNRSLGELYLDNGCVFRGYSSERPGKLRGPQFHRAWGDEPAKWKDASKGTAEDTTWSNLTFCLRLGDDPRVILTGTPKNNRLIRELVKDPDTVVIRGSTYDNLENLAPTFRRQVIDRYEGTRLGRQELNAELLDTVEGALWTPDAIIREGMPDRGWLTKVTVNLDPADGDEEGDEQAISVTGRGLDGRAYLLASEGHRTSPTAWLNRAFTLADEWDANYLVVEKNHGGAFLTTTLNTVRQGRVRDGLPYHAVRIVTAKYGKRLRAEPVAALYEQARVVHCIDDVVLEDQMTSWVPDSGQDSPDRLDALVYGVTDLLVGTQGVPLNPDDHRATPAKRQQRDLVTAPEDDSRRVDRRRKPTSRVPKW